MTDGRPQTADGRRSIWLL